MIFIIFIIAWLVIPWIFLSFMVNWFYKRQVVRFGPIKVNKKTFCCAVPPYMWILILFAPILMVISGGATAINECFEKSEENKKKERLRRQAAFIETANQKTNEKKNVKNENLTPTPDKNANNVDKDSFGESSERNNEEIDKEELQGIF